jgi:hypothetical protein
MYFSGCIDNNPPKNGNNNKPDAIRIVGTWNTSTPIAWYIKPTFTFYNNSTFVVETVNGTYRFINNTLELHWTEADTIFIYEYEFLDDDTLKLISIYEGDQGIYKRQ